MKTNPTPQNINTYISGKGHQLLNTQNWPKKVKVYLETEAQVLAEITKDKCKLILEIGCFTGTYFEWALKYRKKYVGIDIANEWLKLGRHRARLLNTPLDVYEFLKLDALHLEKISQKSKLIPTVEPTQIMAILPFNVIGNISDASRVIRGLQSIGVNYFISSFNTGKEATEVRSEYYKNCEYTGLNRSISDQGVTFSAPMDGFSSIAFDENFYLSPLHNGQKHILKLFGGVGIGCFAVRGLRLSSLTSLLLT